MSQRTTRNRSRDFGARLPLFDKRRVGLLLHPSSLAKGEGIGTLGAGAFETVDWMLEAGFSVWQVLPLVPPGIGHSPYSSWASLAGNPALIDLHDLGGVGLLDEPIEDDESGVRIDFPSLFAWKMPMLHRAARALMEQPHHEWREGLAAFAAESWVEDVALFDVIRREQAASPWWQWPHPLRTRQPEALAKARERNQDLFEESIVIQFFFERQWQALKSYAHERGLTILGDLPIYVAPDSVDVWAQQHLFDLHEDGTAEWVAGVPPDSFNELGQHWGNPLYRWQRMAEEDFVFWHRRVERLLTQVDWIRLDHFRGFESYWAIAASATDGRLGEWLPGPGAALFESLAKRFGSLPFVAEDLGYMDKRVVALREAFDLPSMRVLQFAFDESTPNEHAPVNYSPRMVAYAGTHDNDTLVGWWRALDSKRRLHVLAELQGVDEQEVPAMLTGRLLSSKANLVVLQVQDVLGLGSEARLNIPGRVDGNWTWRLSPSMLSSAKARMLHGLFTRHGRPI
jgi:4-alpha-glucanotransferase